MTIRLGTRGSALALAQTELAANALRLRGFDVQIVIVHTRGDADVSSPLYNPGLYSSPIVLGSQNVNVEVTVSSDQITSVSLVPLSDSIATMYPLMQPAMDSLSEQIVANQSLEGLEYPAGSQYTSMALMNAIKTALNKAVLEQTASTDT